MRNHRFRAALALTAGAAVIVAGPALAAGLGSAAEPGPMPAAWEDSRARDAQNAGASHDAAVKAEKQRKARIKAKKEAERKAREAAEREAAAAAERRAAEERAARARTTQATTQGGTQGGTQGTTQGGTPAQNRALGMQMCADRGWSASQCEDLGRLWQKESGWSSQAHNSSSGAHGIPQALPGSKMASHGSDWATNPRTQIAWGLDYIAGRYGNPSNAWAHSVSHGWY